MSRKEYNSLDDLISDLRNDIVDSMRSNVDKKIKDIYKSKAEASYREYLPKTNNSRYRHGQSGSFADEVNFKEEIEVNKNVLTYTLENHRETDCNCADCRSKNLRIDGYIEDGIAGKSKIKEKLVYEKAQEEVDNKIDSFIMNELKNKGW